MRTCSLAAGVSDQTHRIRISDRGSGSRFKLNTDPDQDLSAKNLQQFCILNIVQVPGEVATQRALLIFTAHHFYPFFGSF